MERTPIGTYVGEFVMARHHGQRKLRAVHMESGSKIIEGKRYKPENLDEIKRRAVPLCCVLEHDSARHTEIRSWHVLTAACALRACEHWGGSTPPALREVPIERTLPALRRLIAAR